MQNQQIIQKIELLCRDEVSSVLTLSPLGPASPGGPRCPWSPCRNTKVPNVNRSCLFGGAQRLENITRIEDY